MENGGICHKKGYFVLRLTFKLKLIYNCFTIYFSSKLGVANLNSFWNLTTPKSLHNTVFSNTVLRAIVMAFVFNLIALLEAYLLIGE